MYLRRLTAANAPAAKAMVNAARASRGGELLLPIGLLSGVVGFEVVGLRERASSLDWVGELGCRSDGIRPAHERASWMLSVLWRVQTYCFLTSNVVTEVSVSPALDQSMNHAFIGENNVRCEK